VRRFYFRGHAGQRARANKINASRARLFRRLEEADKMVKEKNPPDRMDPCTFYGQEEISEMKNTNEKMVTWIELLTAASEERPSIRRRLMKQLGYRTPREDVDILLKVVDMVRAE